MSSQGNWLQSVTMSEDARREVQDLSQRIADELTLRAQIYAEARGAGVVERRDVYQASRAFEEIARPSPPRKKRSRRSLLVAFAGFFAAVTISLIFASAGLGNADKAASILGVVVAMAGLGASVYGWAMTVRGTPSDRPSDSGKVSNAEAGELIAAWRDIETLMREGIPPDELDTARHRSVTLLLEEYAQENGLGRDFVKEVRDFLRVRNRLTHGVGEEVSQVEAEKQLRSVRQVIAQMRDIRDRGMGTSDNG